MKPLANANVANPGDDSVLLVELWRLMMLLFDSRRAGGGVCNDDDCGVRNSIDAPGGHTGVRGVIGVGSSGCGGGGG